MEVNFGTPNWENRTLWTADNLDVMRGMNSDSVDLIYLDPPFNSKRDYAAPIGSESAGAHFRDTWGLSDIDVEWLKLIEANHPKLNYAVRATVTKSDMSYLIYMAPRLMEMHRVLKPTGTLYLHCDPTMSHSLKVVMDTIFGKANFVNEIIWHYKTGGMSKSWFGRKHDVILFYSKTKQYTFNLQEDKSYLTHKYGFKNVEILQDQRGFYTVVGMRDVWDIPALRGNQSETTGYPTQKPLALLDRIIKASSDEGDLVLDPFCGCATTLVAAHLQGRKWVGIDLSDIAVRLCRERIEKHDDIFARDRLLHRNDIIHRNDIPRRTDLGRIPAYDCKPNKDFLYGKQKGNCAGCKTHFEFQHLTVDHVISRSKGGTDHLENLQLLCARCNSTKGTRGMEYLMNYLNAA